MSYGAWAPYVPVHKRRANAEKKMNALRKKGQVILPVKIEGRKITRTFWGNAWCEHLEQFSDYANRLPRGKTYARNGSVCHLDIQEGHIHAMVSGSELYTVDIKIKPLAKPTWNKLKASCTGQVSSMLELLQGKISDSVMAVMTEPETGLFPKKQQIHFRCTCPDEAYMCKHVAAVLYGAGARLDDSPQDLFLLRGVDEKELVSAGIELPKASKKTKTVSSDLSNLFGIDLDDDEEEDDLPPVTSKKVTRKTVRVPNKVSRKAAAKATTTEKKKGVPARPAKKTITKATSSTSSSKRIPKVAATLPPNHGINISRGIRASHIKKLRKYLNMNLTDFAICIGKSPATVKQWEDKKGVLNLHQASQECLDKAFSLNSAQAQKQYRKHKK